MITILVSMALMGQADSLAAGAKMRHEANKMIMGMQNVPYDVADVLNGSNLTVEQATEIAAQRRQMRAVQEKQQRDAAIRKIRSDLSKTVKGWNTLNGFYDKIASEKMILHDQERPTARGHIRTDIANTKQLVEDFGQQIPRNVREAAKLHLKKAEAALAMLDKQGSPPVETKNPGK